MGEREKEELRLEDGLGYVPLKWVSMIVLLNTLGEMRFVYNVFSPSILSVFSFFRSFLMSLPNSNHHLISPLLMSFSGALQGFTNFLTAI